MAPAKKGKGGKKKTSQGEKEGRLAAVPALDLKSHRSDSPAAADWPAVQ